MEQKIQHTSKKLQTSTRNTQTKRKRVKILWRDAISHSEWLSPTEAKHYKPAINTTEGFLLEENEQSTIVYMSYNDTDIGDLTVIPTENIKSFKFVR
jgi:serine protease inhibitor